ncbi:MAG: NUDIX domain-containing protein [Spirochaetaceae bacterium]|nr:NUDIX domain-containing protein [Spirochaetaceae bacterium]
MNLHKTLPYQINLYQGAVLDTDCLPDNESDFLDILKETITEIRKKNLQLIWLYLPKVRADLVASAVNYGFTYHHADENGLQLIFKIYPEAFVPGYATHFIGAGGVLIDDSNRILVIQERCHKHKHYKLPGGVLEPGEHISHAVEREVFEETGISSKFLSLNCFRHWHGYRYGKSDIYFVCRLKPLSFEIKIDHTEISEAIWMPVDDYLSDKDTHPFNRKIVETSLTTTGLKLNTITDYGNPESHEMMF